MKTSTVAMRVIGTGDRCATGERLLVWNKTGRPRWTPGPVGPAGPAGPPGSGDGGGLSGHPVLTGPVTAPAGAYGQEILNCPAGKQVLAGGYQVSSGTPTVVGSYPLSVPTQWITEIHGGASGGTVLMILACVDAT